MEPMCLEFVNSWWHDTEGTVINKLAEPAWLVSFCETWNLPAPAVTNSSLKTLQDFRDALYGVISQLCTEGALSEESMAFLNSGLALGRSQERFYAEGGQYHIETIPKSSALDWLLYHVTASFTNLLLSQGAQRLKHCGNPNCVWFFYDSSKNHSRKWCGNTCASLIKVRKFRAEKKARPAE